MSLDTYQSIEGCDLPPVSDTDPDNIHLSLHSSNDSLPEEMENNYLPGAAQNHSSEEHLDIDSKRLPDENCQEQQQVIEQIKDVHRNQLHLLKKLLVFEDSSKPVKLTFKKGVIVLEGRKGDVVKKKKEILEMMDSFVNETFEMPEGVTKMLRMKEFCHYIENILMFLTIVWAADWNSITIYGRTRDSLRRGYHVIMDELVCCKIELNEENLERLKRPPWLEVVNKLSHPLLMLEQTGTILQIYGTCKKAQRVKAEIGKRLCHYKVHVANLVPLAAFSFFVSCYISKECQDIVKSFQSVGIDFDYVSCSCIISGPSRLIPKIERLIACLAEKIKKYELDLKRRGMSNHFLSPTGMMVLENMQYKYGVFIQNITEGYQDMIQGNGCVNIHSLANDSGNGKRLRNGVIVRLKVGQILECSADARVNVISKELKRYEGMCENRGARIIQLECDENILVTDSGGVPCQKVFHVVSPDVKNGDCLANIRRTVTSILNKAVELRCTSLAIPLIGALFSCLTPDKLYKTIQEAVTEWARVNSDCVVLREVWFVGESYQVNHFLSLMNLNEEFRDYMAIPMDPAHRSHATNQSCLSYETLVKLRLFTRDVSVVSKVLKELEQYSSQVIKSCVIEDEISATIFKNLTVEQVGQIQALEKKFCVRIEVNKIQCRIHIEGEQQYIAEVKYRILELLKLL